MISQHQKQRILNAQKSEITEYYIYKRLAALVKDQASKRILEQVSREELEHYEYWRKFSQEQVPPDRIKIFFYTFASRFLGLTFGIKLNTREIKT